MKKNIKEILETVSQNARRVFKDKLDKVILYGSYARNEQENGSDIDIFLILNQDEKQLKYSEKLADEISCEMGLKYGFVFSILAESREKFLLYKDYIPFYTNIQNEGVILYGQGAD